MTELLNVIGHDNVKMLVVVLALALAFHWTFGSK